MTELIDESVRLLGSGLVYATMFGLTKEPGRSSWSITLPTGKVYEAAGRQLTRWGVAGALVGNRVLMFGGRGRDHQTRNTLHYLDLGLLTISQTKLSPCPGPREGHSCVSYHQQVFVYGGCVTNGSTVKHLDELCVFDTKAKLWEFPTTSGVAPGRREGHAAAILGNEMLIYGGNTAKGLKKDLLKLDLRTFVWSALEVEGDHPGPRESMGCAQYRQHCYVFGGNVSTTDVDIHTNDFYRLTLTGSKVKSCLMNVEGRKPSPRTSNSLSVLDDTRLIVFGGENSRSCLNDVWLYDIPSVTWRELVPDNQIAPRMAHLSFCYQGKLYVFGGFDGTEIKHDLCVLTIEETVTLGCAPQAPPTCCEQCGHEAENCGFLLRFPELGYPRMNFYARCQLSSAMLNQVCAGYCNPILNLVLVPLNLQQSCLSITCDEFVSLDANGKLVKIVREDVDLEFASDEEDELRLKITMKKRSSGKTPVIRLSLDVGLEPNEVAKIVGGTANQNIIGPLLAYSSTLLVVSKTPQFLTISLLSKGPVYVPCYFVVYDSEFRPMFPAASVFHANLSNICQNTHLTLSELKAHEGLSFYINASVFNYDQSELTWEGLSLTDYLAKVFFKSDGAVNFFVQGCPVEAICMKNVLKEKRCKKLKEACRVVYKWSGMHAEEYTYKDNLLVAFKSVPRLAGAKSLRTESSLIRWKLPRSVKGPLESRLAKI